MQRKLNFVVNVGGGLFLVLLCVACDSRAKLSRTEGSASASTLPTPMGRQVDGGSYCVQTIAQGPPLSTPIHFSNKELESDGSSKDFETDLVGDKLDVTIHERHPATEFDRELNTVKGSTPIPIRDGFAESVRTNHFTRTDVSGWTMGANSVVLGATPWGLFINKPTLTEVGPEKVGTFETVRYAVDTTHQTRMDKAALLMAGRLKDYNITGNAWVLKDKNCILQYAIDFDQDESDGKVSKTHYEGGLASQ
jgi:hypothetical protein